MNLGRSGEIGNEVCRVRRAKTSHRVPAHGRRVSENRGVRLVVAAGESGVTVKNLISIGVEYANNRRITRARFACIGKQELNRCTAHTVQASHSDSINHVARCGRISRSNGGTHCANDPQQIFEDEMISGIKIQFETVDVMRVRNGKIALYPRS